MAPDRPYAMPHQLRLVTEVFSAFCRRHDLTLLAAEIDKHGSWEWAAGRTNGLFRALTLDLTQGRDESLYLATTWAVADDGRRFTRLPSGDFRLTAERLSSEDFVTELKEHLLHTWEQAERLTERDLTEDFIIPRTNGHPPTRSSEFGFSDLTAQSAAALSNLATRADSGREYQRASELHEESLRRSRELGDEAGMAGSLNTLGVLAALRGDYIAARTFLEESPAIRQALADRQGIAVPLSNLGIVAANLGEYEMAHALQSEALRLRQALGDHSGIALGLTNLGLVASHLGNDATARLYHEEALSIRRALGDRPGIAQSLGNLGNVSAHLGDFELARSAHEQALAFWQESGDRRGLADSLHELAYIAHHTGDTPRSASLYREALSIRHELGYRQGIAESLEGVASLLATHGDANLAAPLLGAAAALRATIGAPPTPAEQTSTDATIANIRAMLGEREFDSVWTAGEGLAPDAAVADALAATWLLGASQITVDRLLRDS